MVWDIITKWTEQSECLFIQERLDQMRHLVFVEIFNSEKKKKTTKKTNQKKASWVHRHSRKAGG